MKPAEMGMQYFQGVYVLEETLEFKGEWRIQQGVSAQFSVDFPDIQNCR